MTQLSALFVCVKMPLFKCDIFSGGNLQSFHILIIIVTIVQIILKINYIKNRLFKLKFNIENGKFTIQFIITNKTRRDENELKFIDSNISWVNPFDK